jgi:hypothetical protein
MEQFSFAYVRAVAARAGFHVSQPEVDVDSVDLMLSASTRQGFLIRPRLELQVKCTGREVADQGDIPFALPVNNYNDLRADTLVPSLLVLVLVPSEVERWLSETDERLCLHRCGYWLSLRNFPATENTESVTVRFPRSQRFTSSAVQALMTRIERGEEL